MGKDDKTPEDATCSQNPLLVEVSQRRRDYEQGGKVSDHKERVVSSEVLFVEAYVFGHHVVGYLIGVSIHGGTVAKELAHGQLAPQLAVEDHADNEIAVDTVREVEGHGIILLIAFPMAPSTHSRGFVRNFILNKSLGLIFIF